MSTKTAAPPVATPLWRKGDWAAYFGLFSNNLTNLLTMIALLTVVVGLPNEMVFGRIAPAFGLAVFAASIAYTVFGRTLSRQTGRSDVTALPSGPSAPSIFTVTFLVLLPIYKTTNDAEFALNIGLVWCFVEAMILIVGSFLGDALRRIIPRTVLLACLAGLGLLLLAMNPMLQAFASPVVAFVVLVLIFMNWFGKKPIFGKIPTGLLLLVAGTILAWVFGLQSTDAIGAALNSAGFNPPTVHISNFLEGLPVALPYLASAIPLGLANYVFDLENIESAHAAGDPYPTRKVMLANGFSSMGGAFLGNPFPVTVYVGHVGWKSIGAGIGYSLANGATMFLVTLFGLGAFLLSVIPMAAVAPILVYIGIVTANQAVRETPKLEVPVIFIALFPWIANWALTLANNVLKAAGTNAQEVGTEVLGKAGVDYVGLTNLGNGAPLASILWGCIAIFAIRNQPVRAAVSAGAAAVLSFFGVIHAATVGVGLGMTPEIALAYAMVTALFVVKYFRNQANNETEVFLPEGELAAAGSKTAAKTA
jgi:AGZA family xanthine/uracil permease-like MFS transporter